MNKKQLTKKTALHALFVITIVCLSISCSKKTDITWQNTQIPNELINQQQVVNYITEIENAAFEFKKLTQQVIDKTQSNDTTNNTELSKIKTAQLIPISFKIAKTSSKISDLQYQQPILEQNLNQQQVMALKIVVEKIMHQMNHFGPNYKPLTNEHCIANIEQKEKLEAQYQAQNNTPDNYTDNETSLNPESDYYSPDTTNAQAGYTPQNNDTQNNNAPGLQVMLFISAVIAITVISFILKIRKGRTALQNIGHSVSNAKSTINKLATNPSEILGSDKQLTDEEKNNIDKLNKLINKHL